MESNAKWITDDTVRQVAGNHYEVVSPGSQLTYNVRRMQEADVWSCECADFHNALRSGRDKNCRHIRQIRGMICGAVVIEQKHASATPGTCPYCDSTFAVKSGTRLRANGTRRQMYRCKICKRRFADRQNGFWHMRTDPHIVSDALNLAMSGMSYRKIAEHIRYSTGTRVSHVSVGHWIAKYTKMMSDYINNMKPVLGDTWSLDELVLNVKNTKKTKKGFYDWLWSAIDPKTRFLIATIISKGRHTQDASELLDASTKNAGGKPDYIVTDSLPAYDSAIRDFGNDRIQHITSKAIKDTYTNMPIERYHNEIRENLNSRRGLGNDDSAQIYAELLRIHHNFIRPHMGLDGNTPSQEAGLESFADTKYLGLIKEAHDASEKTKNGRGYMDALGDLAAHVRIINEIYRTRICPIEWLENAVWAEIDSILCGLGFVWLFDNHNRCWVKMGNQEQKTKKRRIRRANMAAIRRKPKASSPAGMAGASCLRHDTCRIITH